ncbi:MAG TPA: hypothetical protein VNY05_36035 [Candidatus Acidoferrales bacterium]|nr:hypothetical protein [Candidatus Acidoferrales bacterium]
MLDVKVVAGFADERHGVSAGAESPIDRQSRKVFGIVGSHLDPVRRALKPKMEIGGPQERRGRGESGRQLMLCCPMQRLSVATARLSLELGLMTGPANLRAYISTVSTEG